MKISSVEFKKSILEIKDAPRERKPEIAFAGKSNVGKSSLLNALWGRKNLAKTSNTPGKTRTINFFEVNRKFYMVDLPGYGYAEVPLSLKQQWNKLMFDYLTQSNQLKLVVVLIDSRHGLTDKDISLLDFLEEHSIPTLLVATKIDKLGNAQRKIQLDKIRKELNLDEEAIIVPFSAITKEGVAPLWKIIQEVLEE
ncbi:MAG TPA: ribosome biogenesis GTP-binding protein YihA/YsxC [Candidatus Hydrogenedens sp.]|nr:ribosome biogenesis GTP-binding protein YihA/YsxC [Candidatus Hydrogenedens sp.]HOK09508.1 ribosome biogenesis GTP-binding protein YihA/YsxC [Candidatus Hydrogenedens sp.]HOL20219.1 ribosome biogenesis GTP-binding protein YihA/YsxC [Candidatus Hydrogenedens sp.]HPP59217.1 ribosome biogenesis GTP-binding protein YihA/YsxC [Candidatus Hydrogenedens sp.]